MYPNPLPSLVVRFDSRANLIHVSTLVDDGDAPKGAQIAIISLSDHADHQRQVEILGKIVLESLQTLAGTDQDLPLHDQEFIDSKIEPKARAGDVRAVRAMATYCEFEALRKKAPGLLDEAESWLRQAIALGSKETERFFADVWPTHKKDLLEMIREERGNPPERP